MRGRGGGGAVASAVRSFVAKLVDYGQNKNVRRTPSPALKCSAQFSTDNLYSSTNAKFLPFDAR